MDAKLKESARLLLRLTREEIKRGDEFVSTMVRAGLLRDILEELLNEDRR